MAQSATRFSFPTHIIFGPGARHEIPGECAVLGISRPLIVTDAAMTGTAAFKAVMEVFAGSGIRSETFSEVSPNPLDGDIEVGVRRFLAADCDGIIGVGGGSPMDAAKAIAALAAGGGTIADYAADAPQRRSVIGPLPPVVMVPTTAGTGSEVGRCSVITSTKEKRKVFLCSPLMMPSRAVMDPELTVGLPAHLTAATGMDALTHCIESLTAPIFHPMCDAVALMGIEHVGRYLERAVTRPDDLEARGGMMLAAMMGAVAFQKDLGAAHSLSHALSAVSGLQHGLANAVVLPWVMDYSLESCSALYARTAAALGVDICGLDERAAARQAVTAVRALNRAVGIPESLAAAGIRQETLEETVDKAFLDPCHLTNARPCTREDLKRLLAQAYKGASHG